MLFSSSPCTAPRESVYLREELSHVSDAPFLGVWCHSFCDCPTVDSVGQEDYILGSHRTVTIRETVLAAYCSQGTVQRAD